MNVVNSIKGQEWGLPKGRCLKSYCEKPEEKEWFSKSECQMMCRSEKGTLPVLVRHKYTNEDNEINEINFSGDFDSAFRKNTNFLQEDH
jgi:hypothetical protein